MYDEDDLLPLSALQHFAFCERQCALIHIEQVWDENRLTAEGRLLHDRTDTPGTEIRGGIRIARGLRLQSLRLGLSGKADVVEFHPVGGANARDPCDEDEWSWLGEDSGEQNPETRLADPTDALGAVLGGEGGSSPQGAGVALPGAPGHWVPFPVEYKRGRPKSEPWDEIQLCAQAICLEEMLNAHVPRGALFYGQTQRRRPVAFDGALRRRTEDLARRVHELVGSGRTPAARYAPRCKSCSLVAVCMPKILTPAKSARAYLDQALAEAQQETPAP